MAATVSSAWAKPGAWALDSEEHEEELKREIDQPKPFRPSAASDPPAAEFPSLAAAASAKPKKKNKGQTLSLAEFTTYGSHAPKPASFEPKRLTQDELIMLPTGPRERTAEELDRTRLGGGFRNYGADRDSSRVRVSREGPNRERENMGPSRADEVDDWSKTKKFGSSFGSDNGRSERRDRGGFFNSSRADEVDNWGSNKSFAPTSDPPRRERRMGFESYSNGAGSGADGDNWLKKKEDGVRPTADSDTWGRRREERDLDSENWGRKKEEIGNNPNGNNGVAAPSARPKLNLQPRTLPIVNNAVQSPPSEAVKPKGSNPFGSARPREEVLAEKGQDWKEIDEKLEAVKIKEKEVVSEKGEGFGRRKGFGMGRGDSGDDKTGKSWRKPESKEDNVATPSSAETTENNAETTENSESTENVPEEN